MPPDEIHGATGIASDAPTGERRLADSRADLEALLRGHAPGGFPRSHTMRFLLGRGGGAIAAGAFAGLLAVNPRLAATIFRIVPLGRLARRLL